MSDSTGAALSIGGATAGRLLLSEPAPRSGAVASCLATLELPEQVAARVRVDESGGTFFAGLVAMFDRLASDWRLANTDMAWGSLEGELDLRCSADSLGHVTLAVRLTIDPVAPWRAQGTVVVEAGAVDRLALEAHEFFRQ